MRRLTKTFSENRYYRRTAANSFVELPKSETGEGPTLDEQVKTWVNTTGNIIIHPGQLGMHTSWHGDREDPYQVKCLTFGQVVLYQEPDSERRAIQHPDPSGIDLGANPTPVGPEDSGAWGVPGSSVDGAGWPPGGTGEETIGEPATASGTTETEATTTAAAPPSAAVPAPE